MTNSSDISNKLASALNDSNDAFIKLCQITTSGMLLMSLIKQIV